MSTDAQDAINTLQNYGFSQRNIARWCDCTNVHVNYVKHGKRNASPELTEKLLYLVGRCEQASEIGLKRKPYRWKAGHDPRRHKSKWERYVTRKQKPIGQEATARVVPTTARPNESPKNEPTDKLQEHELALIVQGRLCQRCRDQVRTQRVKVADRQWEMLCPACVASISQPALPQPARSQTTQPYVPPEPLSKPQPVQLQQAANKTRQRCRGCMRDEVPLLWFRGDWLCQWDAVARGYRWEDGKKRAE